MPDYSVPPEDYEFLWPETPEQEAQRRAEATAQIKAQERCATLGCSGTGSKRFLQPICDECALRVWSVIQIEQQEILDRNDADMTEQRRAGTREERLNAPGDIYYIRIGEHIKVGYAKNLSSRLASYPPTATLLATHPRQASASPDPTNTRRTSHAVTPPQRLERTSPVGETTHGRGRRKPPLAGPRR